MFALGSYEPMASLNTLSQFINHLERENNTEFATWSNSNEVIVRAELPGFSTDEIEIEVEGRMLSVCAKENFDNSQNSALEKTPVSRKDHRLRLPFNINADSVQANLDNGVLVVRLPRVESERPRKIEIS